MLVGLLRCGVSGFVDCFRFGFWICLWLVMGLVVLWVAVVILVGFYVADLAFTGLLWFCFVRWVWFCGWEFVACVCGLVCDLGCLVGIVGLMLV